jgi:hypothetical protein
MLRAFNQADVAARAYNLLLALRRSAIRTDLIYVIVCFLASRLWLEGIGILAQTFIQPKLIFEHVWIYSNHPWFNLWGVLDTGWYLGVASNGYSSAPIASGPLSGAANWAFFPAYPMISAFFARILGTPIFPTMVVLSNLCFVGALLLIRQEAEEEFGRSAARATIVLLCVMPGSYIFSSAYTESLFLLAIAATLALVRRGYWVSAGFTAALAVLTRNVGISLILLILFSGWRTLLSIWPRSWFASSSPISQKEAWRIAAAIVLPIFALAGFCVFLYLRTGDALAFVSIQKAWDRHAQFPLTTLLSPLGDLGSLPSNQVLNFIFAWIAVFMLIPLAYWRRWPMLAFSSFLVLAPLSAGLSSYMRFTTTMLPITMAGGALCATYRAAMPVVLVIFATLNGFMMVGWTLGFGFAQ